MMRIDRKAETAVVELFVEILGTTTVHRNYRGFDFLRGDPTPKRPKGVPLPVDAYFPEFNLVLEYMGKQHYKQCDFMDRRPGRRLQRQRYDQRRAEEIPKHGTMFVVVRYDDPLTRELVRHKLRSVGIRR
ncbi:MAG: hypothetical protein AB1792_08670 [Candidatus Zixiibacteriota bacterium]